MHDLNRFVTPEIEARWEDVAYALDFEISTVDSIIEKHRGDPTKCCKALLKLWLISSYGVGPKNWSTLLHKISEVQKLSILSTRITKKLIALPY